MLSGSEGALSPFWSPDSRHIASFAANELKRVDLSGGAVQVTGRTRSGKIMTIVGEPANYSNPRSLGERRLEPPPARQRKFAHVVAACHAAGIILGTAQTCRRAGAWESCRQAYRHLGVPVCCSKCSWARAVRRRALPEFFERIENPEARSSDVRSLPVTIVKPVASGGCGDVAVFHRHALSGFVEQALLFRPDVCDRHSESMTAPVKGIHETSQPGV